MELPEVGSIWDWSGVVYVIVSVDSAEGLVQCRDQHGMVYGENLKYLLLHAKPRVRPVPVVF